MRSLLFRTKILLWSLALAAVPILIMGTVLYSFSVSVVLESDIENAVRMNSNITSNLERIYSDIEDTMIEMLCSMELHSYFTFGSTDYEQSSLDFPDEYESSGLFIKRYEEAVLKTRSVIYIHKNAIHRIVAQPAQDIPRVDIPYGNELAPLAGPEAQAHIYDRTMEDGGQIRWFFLQEPDRENKLLVTAAVRNFSRSDLIGTVVLQIRPGYIGSAIGESGQEVEGIYHVVLTENNQVIYHPDRSLIGETYGEEAVLEAARAGEREASVITRDGEKQIVISETSGLCSWKIISIMPYKSVSQKFDSMVGLIMAFLLCMLACAFLAAFLVSGTAIKPMDSLLGAIKGMDRDNLQIQVIPVRNDEFGTLSMHFNMLVKRINELLVQVKAEQRVKKEAEMNALRAQITPHFLYNALDTIKTLAEDGEVETASQVTEGLIDLLRISIGTNREIIPVAEEIHFVKSYVILQQFRTDASFSVTYDIPARLGRAGVQKLTLQPLVENAIIHGFIGKPGDHRIHISAAEEEGALCLRVRDNGYGLRGGYSPRYYGTETRYTSSGIGLGNVQERIRLRFGEPYGLEIRNVPGGGAEAEVRIPLIFTGNGQQKGASE